MHQNRVKSVTIEYKNGDVETFQEKEMWHRTRQNYKKGATKPHQGFTEHEVTWVDPKSMYPEPE